MCMAWRLFSTLSEKDDENYTVLSWFLSRLLTRQLWHVCAEAHINWDDVKYALGRLFFLCERCGIIVSLSHRAAAGLVWMLWLSCTIHWEQNLLVISEANHQTALKGNHNKPKRNLWKAVQRGTIGAGLVQIRDWFAYYFLLLLWLSCFLRFYKGQSCHINNDMYLPALWEVC